MNKKKILLICGVAGQDGDCLAHLLLQKKYVQQLFLILVCLFALRHSHRLVSSFKPYLLTHRTLLNYKAVQ